MRGANWDRLEQWFVRRVIRDRTYWIKTREEVRCARLSLRLGVAVYLDEETYAAGGGHEGPICLSCKAPIAQGQRSMEVMFMNDPDGHKGLSGEYHIGCAKPFASLAHVMSLGWGH